MPPNEESPVYGQLYIVDTSTSLNVRTARDENNELKEEILLSLGNILSHNPYSNVYKKASTMIDNTQSCQDFSIRFIDNIAMDKRTSSTPSADEIAGIFDSSEGEPPGYRHVVVNFKHGGPKLLSVLSPHCDPMIYPLLFPYGESGWDPSLIHNGPRKQKERNKLTMRQFACHRLAVREDFSHVHQAKKLFQQYLVDTYVRIESDRLDYVRQNQSKLRVEHYKGLQDFVVNKSRLSNSTTGKVVILPSTFQGSPRNLAQRYQDAMAMVRKEGKPDIFLTFTCNPNWPEIKNELKNGEKPCDRPDIVSRVFQCKK